MDHWLGGIVILLFGILLFVEAQRIPKAISLRFGGYVETGNVSPVGSTIIKIIGISLIAFGIYYLITG